MNIQLDLFPNDFLKYHQDNPQIYEAFKKFTIKAINKGHKRWSADAIFHVMRWETEIEGNDQFKVNNNYTALYARMFMEEFPQVKGFFTVRKSKFDQVNLKA